MQNESPVAYASRGLPEAETRYVQIERERERASYWPQCWLLSFKAYLYGQDIVYVKTDHKPPEGNCSKVTQQCTQVFTKNVITTAKIQSRSKVQEETNDVHCRHINCLK